jgi:hypothetical protein
MNKPADERRYLIVIASAMLIVAAMFFGVRPNTDEHAPRKLPALAGWVASHPADFEAASAVTEQALDSPARERFELWREAHAHAATLAPRRAQSRIAFVRSGLFHWYELAPRDRRDVLRNTRPLLHEAGQFRVLARPLFLLTRDFEFLRRNRPDNLDAAGILMNLAATNGLFAEYRVMRGEAVAQRMRAFTSMRATATPGELLALIPPQFDRDDEPLVRGVLDELRRRPLDGSPPDPATVDHIVEYALRHGLESLSGIDAVVVIPGAASDVTRARLALHNGDVEHAAAIQLASSTSDPAAWANYFDERAAAAAKARETTLANAYAARAWLGHRDRQRWRGLCGETLCTRASTEAIATQPRPISLAFASALKDPPSVPAWVEIYVDDERRAEGVVAMSASFAAGAIAPGAHAVDVRIANPFTPDARQRRLVPPPAPL